jgi:lysozyme
MWEAIEADDFEEAAAQMLSSKWAEQVKQRAVELAEIMRHGQEETP